MTKNCNTNFKTDNVVRGILQQNVPIIYFCFQNYIFFKCQVMILSE